MPRRSAGSGTAAHAALVFDDGGSAQGWCQCGSPRELPGIKHKREYDRDPQPLPGWRIICLFVDKKHRGQGTARAALEGALDQIAHLGGGLVEAITEVTAGRQAPGLASAAGSAVGGPPAVRRAALARVR